MFCGFNKEMLDGLRMFGTGLWKQAQVRAAKDGMTLRESVKSEIDEMNSFLDMLAELPEEGQRTRAIVGSALLARFLYQNAANVESPEEIERCFLEGSENFVDFLSRMDDTYYEKLRPSCSSQKEALKQLGEWIRSN